MNLSKEQFTKEMGYGNDIESKWQDCYNEQYQSWLIQKAKQNVCDSTRSVYPLLCAGCERQKEIDFGELVKIIIPKKIKSEYMQAAFIIFRDALTEAGYKVIEKR